jgi:DNA-3-methyladenine glycosylase II
LLSELNNSKIMEKAIKHLNQKDKILEQIIEDYGFPVIQKREEGFASMCHIILEQQVSIASAKATYLKLKNYFHEITPEKIANASDEELRSCGLSRQKSLYVKDLAEKVLNKDIDFSTFSTKTEVQIRSELITIKGVGNWSIEVYLMFCLQMPDIIPLGDIAIKNTMKLLYNTQTIDKMEAISNTWKPYRTMASYIIWHHYLSKRK